MLVSGACALGEKALNLFWSYIKTFECMSEIRELTAQSPVTEVIWCSTYLVTAPSNTLTSATSLGSVKISGLAARP